MKYALLIYPGTSRELYSTHPEEEQSAIFEEFMALARDSATLASNQLQPAATATTVRVDNGRTLTTDGPFADTKEVIGGFYLVDAANLDEALEFAARIPSARMGGTVEVQRIVER